MCCYFKNASGIWSCDRAFEGGNAAYARANLLLMDKDRRSDGLLSVCSPCGVDLVIPSFSLYYFIAVREYMDYSGDVSLGKQVYAKLVSLLETFLKKRENGLILRFGDSCRSYGQRATDLRADRAKRFFGLLLAHAVL